METPSLSEIRQSLAGTRELLRGNKAGLTHFNLTEDGFWRSFFALLLVLPLMLVVDGVFSANETTALTAKLTRSSVNLILHWMLFAAIALPLCHAAGLGQRYMAFITVYNWSSIIVVAMFLVPALFVLSGILTLEGGQFFITATSIYAIYFLWFAAKTALESNAWVAAGFILLDFCLNVIVNGLLGLN